MDGRRIPLSQRTRSNSNRNLKKIFDHTAKFVLAHYTLSGKDHNEYWRYYKDLEAELNTLDYVQQQASNPDKLKWDNSQLFVPYNYWSLLDGYGLLNRS